MFRYLCETETEVQQFCHLIKIPFYKKKNWPTQRDNSTNITLQVAIFEPCVFDSTSVGPYQSTAFIMYIQ